MSEKLELIEKQKIAEFGFWVYLMTDLLMFAVLFGTFAVLRKNTFGGPNEAMLYSLPFVFIETMLLLTSSFTVGLALLSARAKNKFSTILFLLITYSLGIGFLGMEIYEFSELFREGHSWQASASLSSFFALVGMHGLHILAGLFWLFIIILYINKRGLTQLSLRKITLFSLFWHFLDIVWIFIFTFVYLIGVVL